MTLDEWKTSAAQSHAQILQARGALAQRLEDVSWRTNDSVIALVKTNLGQIDRSALPLSPSGSATARVLSGEKSAAWWEAQADTIRATVADTSNYLGQAVPTWSRINAEIIRPTLIEVRDTAGEVVKEAVKVLPWWVVPVVAASLVVGVVILGAVYLPKPKGA